jgi:phospholipase C
MRTRAGVGLVTATMTLATTMGALSTGVQQARSAPAASVAAPINHILVLMQENRSYDSYFGQLYHEGQPASEVEPTTGNPDPTNPSNPPIVPFNQTQLCANADLGHSWDQTHQEFAGGAMSGFTATNANPDDPTGARSMGYYDHGQLPFYYQLANTFGIGDRYFASVLSQTFPNRYYLLAGTSFGHTDNTGPPAGGWTQTNIFDRMDAAGITWKIYQSQFAFGALFHTVQAEAATHVFPISQYYADAKAGTLPQVAYLDPIFVGSPNVETDEHPVSNVEVGQKFVYKAVKALEKSPNWSDSAMFLTYDEHGGFYDHVTPPAAVAPDGIAPMLPAGDPYPSPPNNFDKYGVRVPAIVISAWAKPHFVSHVVNDHTSILKFIENRFALPTLTARDAAANDMTEFFDFSSPSFPTPPALTKPSTKPCWAQDVTVNNSAGDPTQLVAGDSIAVTFDKTLGKPSGHASIQVTDGDGTVATLVNKSNAKFKLDISKTVLTVTLTGAPIVSTPGTITGVQFPARITAASGIADPGAKPWDLTQSPDLILGTAAGQ